MNYPFCNLSWIHQELTDMYPVLAVMSHV